MSEHIFDDDVDLVIRGGIIRALDAEHVITDALAVRAGRVVAVGSAARTMRTREIIELDGRTALPGINDAHLHGAWLGARWPHLFFSDTPPAEQPAGRLVSTEAERRAALRRTWALLAELGITSYTEPGIGPGENDGETGCLGDDMLRTYLDLHREGAQTSRVTLLRLFGTVDGESRLDDFTRGIATPAPDTDPLWLAVTGVKVFADGIPPMATAWVCEPYPDGTDGHLLTRGGTDPLDAFRTMISLAAKQGLQVAVHATGDRSIDEFITALESADDAPRPAAPHYVVHGDLATPAQIERLRRLDAGFAVQPLIAEHTHEWAGAMLGAERIQRAWPLDEMIRSGVRTTVTSDAPIATPDWRIGMDAALAALGRDDSTTRSELLRRLTLVPAEQDGAADWKGSLEVGKVADLVVLDEDPLETGRSVADIGIARTVVDGRTVFARD
ncbi:amidohydrolase [Microbacterium sp. NPDC089987]|uniref:amidohydrolase n=1 Tax=Microbacterium sp. NPDC089987 TaxID=3364202 RepID=UPI0038018DAE